MPLLLKKSFRLEPIPDNLKPDEEVFVCPATKEIFRDYESFFNRHFLCESLLWTCELSGQSNLTYSQALKSENDSRKQLDSLPPVYQKAALTLVHHTKRTNIKTLAEEIIAFYRHRFIKGEVIDLVQMRPVGMKVTTPVRVTKVIPPSSPPVTATSPFKSPSEPSSDTFGNSLSSPSMVNAYVSSPKTDLNLGTDFSVDHTRNGLTSPKDFDKSTPAKQIFKSPKPPRTPVTPLSSEISLKPEDYRYIVTEIDSPENSKDVKGGELCRTKGIFTTNKLKILFRIALYRKSEKHPFTIKEVFINRYDLGPTTVDHSSLPSPSSSSRKRSLSQSQISSYFSLDTPSMFSVSLSESKPKKPRTLSLGTSNKRKKSSKKRLSTSSGKRTPSGKGTKSKKSKIRLLKSPFHKLSNSPSKKSSTKLINSVPSTPKSPKTPRSTMEALKVLNKAKKFKQLDLKNSVVHRDTKEPLSAVELAELKCRNEEDRLRRVQLWEAEKQRRKEDRLKKIRETQEQKRLERMKQKQWLQPREDTLCEDSKELPSANPIKTDLPSELFGEAAMVLEFLQSFGPLFNIKEVIRGEISFDKVVYAVTTHEIESLLFDVVKFLLQAIFATMEEEHEGQIDIKSATARKPGGTPHEGVLYTSVDDNNTVTGSEQKETDPQRNQDNALEEDPEATDDDEMEEEKEKPKSLDVRVECIKVSAALSATWSYSTQRVPLKEMILDPYTCTEVLRLHLLSSGGYTDTEGRNWFRHCRRGGYLDSDDPAISLRLRRPDIISALGRSSIYALSPGDKLEVLSILCTQLLTYVDAREFIEETTIKVKKARRKIRDILFSEERRMKEEKSAQYKEKMEKARLKKQHEKKAEETTLPNESGNENGLKIAGEGDATKPDPTLADPSENTMAHLTEETRKSLKGSPIANSGNRGHIETQEDKPTEKETEEEHRAKMDEQLFDLHQELLEASACVNLQPLGMDRNYSKYWVFPNIPGLFVEHAMKRSVPDEAHQPSPAVSADLSVSPAVGMTGDKDQHSLPCESPCLQPSAVANLNTIKVEEKELNPVQDMADSNRLSMLQVSTDNATMSAWSCHATLEEIDNLIASLNPRGLREVQLKKAVQTYRRHFELSLPKGLFHPDRDPPAPSAGLISNAEEYLELYLREQILDIEDKIVVGNLGYLKEVDNRVDWRDAIENSGAAASLVHNKFTESSSFVNLSTCDSPAAASGSTTPLTTPSVRELPAALLQVYNGIEKKFLMPPLGTAIDLKTRTRKTKKDSVVKDSDICPEVWKASLAKATSFSQVFVHLATLERAVMWSRSLMNVRCRICRRKCGDEFLLLCDGCDHGYHTYCLKPPLKQIPDGNWYCSDCNPVTPIKPRRNVKQITIIEDDSSESEANQENESDEESEMMDDTDESEEEDEPVLRVTRSKVYEPPTRGRKRQGRGGNSAQSRKQTKVVKITRGKQQSGKQKAKVTKATTRRQSGPSTPEVTQSVDTSRSRKKLKLDGPVSQILSKSEALVASIIDLRCSRNSKTHTGASKREQKGLEMQLCEALWGEIQQEKESWYFDAPVTKREYPDYFDLITMPMDLHTIKQKIKTGQYDSLSNCIHDIRLIFTNCIKYHKRHSQIGKAGTSLKTLFEKRCSDLGLSDLGLMSSEDDAMKSINKTVRRTSDRQKSNSLTF